MVCSRSGVSVHLGAGIQLCRRARVTNSPAPGPSSEVLTPGGPVMLVNIIGRALWMVCPSSSVAEGIPGLWVRRAGASRAFPDRETFFGLVDWLSS